MKENPGGGTEVPARDTDKAELADVTLKWSDVGLFLAFYLGLVAVWTAIGEAITHAPWIEARDQSIAEWFVAGRTPDLDTLSAVGSNLAETLPKIAVTAVVAIVMKLVWKRWREPLMMVVPLVLEASVFITVTFFVSRPRPDVKQLDSSPVASSFPSGHVAAGTVYGAVIIIVFWHLRSRIARAAIVAWSAAIPIVVGWARMYRGMHHFTDVLAGVLLGVASLVLSWWLIHRAVRRTELALESHAPPVSSISPSSATDFGLPAASEAG